MHPKTSRSRIPDAVAEFEAIPGYIERFAAARETADDAVQLFLRHVRGRLELLLRA